MSDKAYPAHELWLIPGSQKLYGDDTLAQVATQAGEVAGALNRTAAIPLRIVLRPVVTDAQEIESVCQQANATAACVGVIVWMHTFSPAKMWISGLSALRKPLLHLHTQFSAALPWSEIDMDYMNLNQSAHGDREFALPDDPSWPARARSWSATGATRDA